jgi:para-nitrobenzyl esterase
LSNRIGQGHGFARCGISPLNSLILTQIINLMIRNIAKAITGLLLLMLCVAFWACAQDPNTVVKTRQGYINGLSENSILVFKGIPYAAPPVGSLRFMPPVAHSTWTDTLQATKFGSKAMQSSGGKVTGSEDCLFLNVYTPAADHNKRAVVVWVHGGSMTTGSGPGMDGHAFSDHDDIVTVTINYRLGVFGFMYLGDIDKRYAASANNGVLDCIMALKWIKENIASFGGDPGRVTIMGESAGAKLISAVLCAPGSKGLYQQYIAESGSVQCIRDTVTAKNERLRILQSTNPAEKDSRALLDLSADSLMKLQVKAASGVSATSFFGPVIDGVVIKNDPYQYAAGNKLPKIKALIGTNKTEASLFIAMDSRYKNPDSLLLKEMFGDDYPMVYKSYAEWSKTLSPGDAAVKTLTEYMYEMHSYRWAKALSQQGIPVWMYRFDYAAGRLGPAHGAELAFIWVNTSKEINELARSMHEAWVAFIKTGDPNTSSLPHWPNYNAASKQIMVFNDKSDVVSLTDVFDDKDFPSSVFVLKK